MKKIILTLCLVFSSFIFNDVTVSNAENNVENNEANINNILINNNELLERRIIEIEREMYLKILIQYVEFDAEIIIPECFDVKYVEYTYTVANDLEIPSRIAFRLIFKESTFNDAVVSPKGAKGLMQLMPETRKKYYNELRVDTMKLDKNQEDIYIGLYYVKDLQKYWRERGNTEKNLMKLSLAAYNAGIGNVIKYKGVPPFKETTDFITFILKSHSNPQFFAGFSKKYENEIKNRT